MTKRPHRNHAQAFKAKVGLAAVKGEKTLAVLIPIEVAVRWAKSARSCGVRSRPGKA